ncbi:MAG TPA: hypothetical protein VJQ50_06805 [Terriglobales bacterium]|nr:hypothetical protein [Terriglobales bacterium]
MPTRSAAKPPESPDSAQAIEHLSRARQVLRSLREKLENAEHHAQLDEAITKVELALSALTIQTGGFL